MLRYLEIKDMLRTMIESMQPGEKLPSRTSLINKLETTRTTLDKALLELQREGLVVAKKGIGTFVTNTLTGSSPEMENWGVIVPSLGESIYTGLIQGIESFAHNRGINLVMCVSYNNKGVQEYNISRLMNSIVRGFIIVPIVSNSIEDNYHTYQKLIDGKIPFVFCNRPVEGVNAPAVVSNDFYGGYIATRHLIERGYRNIAYIARRRYSTSINRFQGYASALQECGLPLIPAYVNMDNGECIDDIYTLCRQMLTRNPEIDAIFCYNDYIALQVYRCLADMGLRVSEDVGVIGYDNTEDGHTLVPRLTTVSYRNHEIGQKAAEILWNTIHQSDWSNDFPYYLFQPRIITNGSCLGPVHDEA